MCGEEMWGDVHHTPTNPLPMQYASSAHHHRNHFQPFLSLALDRSALSLGDFKIENHSSLTRYHVPFSKCLPTMPVASSNLCLPCLHGSMAYNGSLSIEISPVDEVKAWSCNPLTQPCNCYLSKTILAHISPKNFT